MQLHNNQGKITREENFTTTFSLSQHTICTTMWSNSNHKGVERIMKAKDCLLQRRSCRRFLDKPIDREPIRQIIDLARMERRSRPSGM